MEWSIPEPEGMATNTPAEQLRTFALYCRPQRNLYNGTYSKADWGGRWGWALKTEVLNWRQRKLFSYTGTQNVNFFITAKKLRTFSVYCQFA
jgi:hypothetical protein